MWEESFKWLNEHYHSLALMLVSGGIVFVGLQQYYHWTHRVKGVERDCEKIDNHIVPKLSSIDNRVIGTERDCEKIDSHIVPKLSSIDSSIAILNNSIATLNSSVNSLVVYLKIKDDKLYFSRDKLVHFVCM